MSKCRTMEVEEGSAPLKAGATRREPWWRRASQSDGKGLDVCRLLAAVTLVTLMLLFHSTLFASSCPLHQATTLVPNTNTTQSSSPPNESVATSPPQHRAPRRQKTHRHKPLPFDPARTTTTTSLPPRCYGKNVSNDMHLRVRVCRYPDDTMTVELFLEGSPLVSYAEPSSRLLVQWLAQCTDDASDPAGCPLYAPENTRACPLKSSFDTVTQLCLIAPQKPLSLVIDGIVFSLDETLAVIQFVLIHGR